jgi:hypothetical protein
LRELGTVKASGATSAPPIVLACEAGRDMLSSGAQQLHIPRMMLLGPFGHDALGHAFAGTRYGADDGDALEGDRYGCGRDPVPG